MSPLLSLSLLNPVENLLNRVLRQDSRALAQLERIGPGRILAIDCNAPVSWQLFLRVGEDRLELLSACEDEPDCRITAPAHALASLLLSEDSNARMREADIELSGDTMLAARLQKLLRELDIDWEDQLAPIMGNLASHQSAEAIRGARQWSAKSREQLQQTLREYLQEELRILPDREEAEAFSDRLDELRLRIDRLNARLNRLSSFQDLET